MVSSNVLVVGESDDWDVPLAISLSGFFAEVTFGMADGAHWGFNVSDGDAIYPMDPIEGVAASFYYPGDPNHLYRKLSKSINEILIKFRIIP